MNADYEMAVVRFSQLGITTREQLVTEALRVAMTRAAASGAEPTDQLFALMKKQTESYFDVFPADRNDFQEIYNLLNTFDLYDFIVAIHREDRSGTAITPPQLIGYITNRIRHLQPETVLITDAERHLLGLRELVSECPGSVTLSTQNNVYYLLLKWIFRDNTRVVVRNVSIYLPLPFDSHYKYIFCLPVFGGKVWSDTQDFLTRDYDGVALENLLNALGQDGTMDFIAPAKLTFASGGYELLRKKVTDSLFLERLAILPEGIFRPWTAIKTYLISMTALPLEEISICQLVTDGSGLQPGLSRALPLPELLQHGDWRIDLLLSDSDHNLQQFKLSSTPKVKLREIAEVFRGKSILRKDVETGSISVLNISDIEDGDIVYGRMDLISEEERKMKRYELLDGDVVMPCRGTAIKAAVYQKQSGIVIASANIIVIRISKNFDPYYVRLFLESPVGSVMIKSFQRGTTIMNISPADIMELELPALEKSEQEEIVKLYTAERALYQETVTKAEKRFESCCEKLYERMI